MRRDLDLGIDVDFALDAGDRIWAVLGLRGNSMSKKLRGFIPIAIATAVAAIASLGGTAAWAQNVVTDPSGMFSVGIGPDGELFDRTSGIGFLRRSDGYDPLAPGTPRDSWGVETSAGPAFGDVENNGTENLTGTTQTIGPSSATSLTTTSVGVTLSQSYSFLQPNVLKVTETIINSSGGLLTRVLFQRDIDWDVMPTEADENSFGDPITGRVNDSSFDGFEFPDPSQPYRSSCATGCSQTNGDFGGGINVTLGDLSAGASDTITFLYGISAIGENVNGLISEVDADGANYWIATQSSENGAYPLLGTNSAIIAVESGVPEPSTWAMMLIGLAGLGFAGSRWARPASS
jgi:PEP-CTERM motif